MDTVYFISTVPIKYKNSKDGDVYSISNVAYRYKNFFVPELLTSNVLPSVVLLNCPVFTYHGGAIGQM